MGILLLKGHRDSSGQRPPYANCFWFFRLVEGPVLNDIQARFMEGLYPPQKLTWLAGKSTMNEDVFPIEQMVDLPACHVSFQGTWVLNTWCCWFVQATVLPAITASSKGAGKARSDGRIWVSLGWMVTRCDAPPGGGGGEWCWGRLNGTVKQPMRRYLRIYRKNQPKVVKYTIHRWYGQ